MKEDKRSCYAGGDGGFGTPGSDYTLIWEPRKFVFVQSHGVIHLLVVFQVNNLKQRMLGSVVLLVVVNINCDDLNSNIASTATTVVVLLVVVF